MGRSTSSGRRGRQTGRRKKESRKEMSDPDKRMALEAALKKRKEKLTTKKHNGVTLKNHSKAVAAERTHPVDQLLAKAEESLEKFNFEEAKRFCKKALQRKPKHTGALEMLADLLAEEGDVEKAKECFIKAVEIEPDVGYVKYMYLGQLAEGLEAIKYYEKGLHIMEKERQVKDNNVKKEAPNECLVTSPEISRGYSSIAEIYLTDACFADNAEQRCKECLDRAVEEDPRNAEAHQLVASYWLSKENKENAKASIETSLSLWVQEEEEDIEGSAGGEKPANYEMSYSSRIECSKILIELEDLERAESVLTRMLEESDMVAQVWYMMGLIQVQWNTEPSKPYGRYYLNRAKKVFQLTECEDLPLMEHITELLEQLGPGEGEAEDWLEHAQMVEEGLKEIDEGDEYEDSSSEDEADDMVH